MVVWCRDGFFTKEHPQDGKPRQDRIPKQVLPARDPPSREQLPSYPF
jgi:hypothetical protein